ncbi:MAG: LamG domain-containing protein, partial [Limisphaerales bacterium]
YQWFTNNVAVGGATNISFTFTNCQLDSPTNFSVIVTNIYGSTTSQMSVAYLPAPTAPYPQGVLAGQPAAFWRLNEQPNNGPGNNGTIGNDYESGNNGIYTNVVLDQQGNDSTEPTETSVGFGTGGIDNSYLGSINSLDFAKPTGSNGEFTVDAWANCGAVDTGAPIISQGTYGVSDAFNLGADSSRHYQFYVRTANGTVYTADSTMEMDDGYWHFVAGVCDEANSNLSLYIDGQQVAKAYIPTNSGVYEADAPMAIGAGTQNAASGYNVQFFGNIDDVAAYKYPLSAGQIAQVFGPVPITFFAPLPPTNAVFEANETLSISATAFGDPPIGYYWTNLTTGLVMGSGTTNVLRDLNASLIISNAPASLSGDQLELVVTNANSSTNWMTTLFSPPPPETISYTNSILYSNDFNGGTWPLAGMPASFANSLVGGTNTVWTDALGTNDTGIMQASGVDASTLGDSWVLPFTPEPGYVYT